ncbi:MAG: cache domain-containing protein [Spirochaetales bacterium]|nr:cache domain-containing protein [Spirochaetales bacterium]
MKLYMIAINIFAIMILLTLFGLTSTLVKRQELDNTKLILSDVVDIPFSLAESMEKEIRISGNDFREPIKNDYLGIIDKMKYGKNNFFFIVDGNGRMVHHPLAPELTWWNMNFETDKNGNFFFRDIIQFAKRDGFFYREIDWQSKYNKELYEPQIIYGRYFWSWDWIICTVIYENELESLTTNSGIYFSFAAVIQILLNTIIYVIYRKKS